MKISKDILKSFNIDLTPIERIRLLKSRGINNIGELSRLSGIPFSQFLKLSSLGSSSEDIDFLEIKGQSLKSNEIHFYEIIGALIRLRLIDNLIIAGESDFVETLLSGNFVKYKKEGNELVSDGLSASIKKEFLEIINTDPNILVLTPKIGGYLAKNNLIIRDIGDLSINQLDILHQGISEINPNYRLLKEIREILKEKLKGFLSTS